LDKDYRLCCNFFIILYLKEGHNKYQEQAGDALKRRLLLVLVHK